MIDYLILPEKIMSHDTVEVPNEKEPICLNLVIIKGIHSLHTCAGKTADSVLVYDGPLAALSPPYDAACLGTAKVYEVKHMVLADILRYPHLLKYFHDKRYNKFVALKQHLRDRFEGLINGEIVTLVLFTPGEGLLDGTTATAENSQSPEQETV